MHKFLLLTAFLFGLQWGAIRGQNARYQWVTPEQLGLENFDPLPTAPPKRLTRSQRIDYEPHLPDTIHDRSTFTRYIQLAFHYMNTTDTFYTEYEGAEGLRYAKDLTHYMNVHLERNEPYSLNPDLPVYDPPWRYELGRKPGTEERAVYHHYSDSDYDYVHSGPHSNRGRRNVNKYADGLDSLLHIFIMAPPRDSMDSPTYTPNGPIGLWNGKVIKVAGFYPRIKPWRHRRNLNHEVGHALGLPHAWLRNDGCDDTAVHPNNCWIRSDRPECDSLTSNNMMDYNVHQLTLTPCQIGRVNARLSTVGSKQRRWIKPLWCKSYDGYSVRIKEFAVWTGGRDMLGDIIVTTGTRLRIEGRVHLPADARITVEPGATLELGPDAFLHNDCGQNWQGIELGRKRRQEGRIITEPGFRIQNAMIHL
ncbi:MAG: hypothetical protein AAF741_17885 [Bacteroidota bacterium]